MTGHPSTSKPASVPSALVKARTALEAIYADRLRCLVLFGSHARGDATADSDVDLLLVLKGPVDPQEEARRTSDVVVDAAVDDGIALSLTHVSTTTWDDTSRSFVRNIRREGVEI
jgi:predicted nucleotidyltransferase